jgi:hypothetical protein
MNEEVIDLAKKIKTKVEAAKPAKKIEIEIKKIPKESKEIISRPHYIPGFWKSTGNTTMGSKISQRSSYTPGPWKPRYVFGSWKGTN